MIACFIFIAPVLNLLTDVFHEGFRLNRIRHFVPKVYSANNFCPPVSLGVIKVTTNSTSSCLVISS